MEMESVTSSLIASIGWENGILRVEFANGDSWDYLGVDEATFRSVVNAPSVGKAFLARIKGHYRAEKG